jgi:uncharacterized protein (AIM24 family)
MKKTYCFLMCCLLTLAACTEEFAPSVDYGERTYINDYQKLVDAVNDLSMSLDKRMEALNKLVESGLADIKISVDANTGDIHVLNATLHDRLSDISSSLSTINVTLLDGFKSLNTVVQDNGNRIVYALNSNGDLIALHLDKNGELISGTIKAQVSELIKTLNDNNGSLQDKLDALNTVIETGMADVIVKMGESSNTLNVQFETSNGMIDALVNTLDRNFGSLKDVLGGNFGSLQEALDKNFNTLGETLLSGFTTLKNAVEDNGDRIVYALNSNGDLIALHLDQNGELINATIKGQVGELIKTLNSNNVSLIEKLDAMNTVAETGMADISVKISESNRTLNVQFENTNGMMDDLRATLDDNFESLNLALLNGFTAVKDAVKDNGDRVVYALNSNGELIALHLDQNGQLIDATMKTQVASLISALNSNSTSLQGKLDAMSTIIETGLANIVVKVGDMGDALDARLETTNTTLSTINTSLGTINTTLGTINTNLLNGFNLVDAKLDSIKRTLTTKLDAHTTAINKLNSDVVAAITTLTENAATQNANLISAVNTQGEAIVAAIGANGELIGALQTAVVTGMGTNTTTITDAIAATRNTELKQILDELKTNNDKTETLLNMQNGLKFSDGTHEVDGVTKYDYMYMAPELYQTIMADATLKKTFQNMLYDVSVPIPDAGDYSVHCSNTKSVSGGELSYNCSWEVVSKDPAAVVITSTVVVDGHQWLVVRSVCASTTLRFRMYDDLFPYTYYIVATDAKGTDRAAFGAINYTGEVSPIDIVLYNYDISTGVFCNADEVTFTTYNSSIQ